MKVMHDTIDGSLRCKIKDKNKFNPSAVTLIHDDCWKQKVIGHLPLYLSKTFCPLFELPDYSTSVMLIGKWVNGGADDGLEIPAEYKFFWKKRTVSRVEKQVNKNDEIVCNMENRCMK